MCLVRLNIKCGPKYATKDITCYKVLIKNLPGEVFHGTYYSPYKLFEYKLKECVSSNFDFRLSPTILSSPQKEYRYLKKLAVFDFVTQGLHSYKYLSAAIGCVYRRGGIVTECTIPKGSWYYEGTDNELVSDNIIINREIKI